MMLGLGIGLRDREGAGLLSHVPTVVTLPAITGTTTVGQTLSASDGTWTGSPVSYAYQWYADEVAIDAATSDSYLLTETEVDAEITVGVVATNAIGDSAEATSEPVGPVAAA